MTQKKKTMKNKLTVAHLHRILANPFYCIDIDPTLCVQHPKMITKEEFVRVAVNYVKENGVKKYVENLLANLEGDYIVSDESN